MIKNGEIALVINTVEERRNAIADSRMIRTNSLAARVTFFTTIAGARAAVEGLQSMRPGDGLKVYSLQALPATLPSQYRHRVDETVVLRTGEERHSRSPRPVLLS